MQTITTVGLDEHLVASGVYATYLNGQFTGITENWIQHQRGDGALITRTERDAAPFGSTILVESVARGGRIASFEVRWKNSNYDAVKEANALYQIARSTIVVDRAIDNQPPRHETYPAGSRLVVFPLMHIYTGDVLREVAAAKAPVRVLLPTIVNPGDHVNLLAPTFEERRARQLGVETLEVLGREQALLQWEYAAAEPENVDFWTDEAYLLVRSVWHQNDAMTWDVRLIDYLRVE